MIHTHTIEISFDGQTCSACGYASFLPLLTENTYKGQWHCLLFAKKLLDKSAFPADSKKEPPQRCGECLELIRRHLATPEFQG
jgi:hypothetical protein